MASPTFLVQHREYITLLYCLSYLMYPKLLRF